MMDAAYVGALADFQRAGGVLFQGEYPVFAPTVHSTFGGAPFLEEPGLACLSRPEVNRKPLDAFLAGFEHFDRSYVEELPELPPGAQLCKTAGQLCYLSFSDKRTRNSDAMAYFNNIRSSGHGSVLEHANYSFLFWGIDRAVTHELVRHRAGMAYSQVSQRYCGPLTLRFVLRPEFNTAELRDGALEGFERSRAEYLELLSELGPLKDRKTRHQAARAVLPNCTEAPIIVTGNVRAWRHFLELRANKHADLTIQSLAVRAFLALRVMEPILFADYHLTDEGVVTETRKV